MQKFYVLGREGTASVISDAGQRASWLVVLALSALTACATVATRNDIVRTRAAVDLDCPSDKVNVEYRGRQLHVARGCGRRETYHVFCGSTTIASLCRPEK